MNPDRRFLTEEGARALTALDSLDDAGLFEMFVFALSERLVGAPLLRQRIDDARLGQEVACLRKDAQAIAEALRTLRGPARSEQARAGPSGRGT